MNNVLLAVGTWRTWGKAKVFSEALAIFFYPGTTRFTSYSACDFPDLSQVYGASVLQHSACISTVIPGAALHTFVESELELNYAFNSS